MLTRACKSSNRRPVGHRDLPPDSLDCCRRVLNLRLVLILKRLPFSPEPLAMLHRLSLPRHPLLVLGLIASSATLIGCVPQKQYDDVVTAYRSAEQQLLACQAELESSRANENALRNQLARAAEDLRSLEGFRDGQRGDIDKLLADYQALLAQLDQLKIGPLPDNLTAMLIDLANRHPELLTFDPKRGMLRFNSDFTFDLGEATLKSNAQQLIRQLAQILNSVEAAPFEVKVVGHTDTVPIRKASTAAKHPTNLHLSAHRAISVRDAMVGSGVVPGRVQIAGWGEFRPIGSSSNRGAAENRRVEIFLTPATGNFDAPASSASSSGGNTVNTPRRAPVTPVDDEPVK